MSSIIEKAREIVAVNGLADKITLLQGKMEEVQQRRYYHFGVDGLLPPLREHVGHRPICS